MIQVFSKNGFTIQYQISDFGTKISFESTNWQSFHICFAKKRKKNSKKRINLRLKKIMDDIKKGIQKTMTDFQGLVTKIKEKIHKYVPRIKTPFYKIYEGDELSTIEKVSYNYSTEYKGDIRHLFLFYDWKKVDEIEKKLDNKEREYSLSFTLKILIFMCKRRILTFTDLIEELHENEKFAEVFELKPHQIPSRKVFSRAADRFGIESFRQITIAMVKECLSLGLIKGRLVGVDGSLIKSNTSHHKNKELNEYTDKDAGLYVRGNYIKGVGYLSYKLVDLEFGLPMLVQCHKGSANENPLLIDIITQFYEIYGFYPEMMSIDKGMDSAENNKFGNEKGIGTYIQARDFGNKPLIKTEKGKTFHPEYVEITDPRVLEIIANRRSECEREFSSDKWGYKRERMSNRGKKEAELFMLITMITTLLTAITAFCVGRPDLIRSPSAFKRLY